MPTSVLCIEGYEHAGKSYMYFGPTPTLLRLPTAALTDSLDGRTGMVSMPFAFVVLMVALGRICWRVRRWSRPNRGDGDHEDAVVGVDEVLAGVTAFVLGAGTIIVFLGVGPYVYHEAILWGVALAFAAFVAMLAWIERPRAGVLVAAAVLTMLALLSRLAVGIGPAAALALVAVAIAVARIWPGARRATARLGLATEGLGWGTVGWLATAVVVPLAVYAAINLAKFGTLFSVPYDHQAANAVVPGPRHDLGRQPRHAHQHRRGAHQPVAVPAARRVPPRRLVAVGAAALVAADGLRRPALRHARLHVERHRGHAAAVRARGRRVRHDGPHSRARS